MLEVKKTAFDGLTVDEQGEQPNNGCGKEMADYLRITHGGDTIAIYSDAMEPEDATFSRNLKWVAAAILSAYELGKRDC